MSFRKWYDEDVLRVSMLIAFRVVLNVATGNVVNFNPRRGRVFLAAGRGSHGA